MKKLLIIIFIFTLVNGLYSEKESISKTNKIKTERIHKLITDALVLSRRGYYNEAIILLNKAKSLDPENNNIHDYIKYVEEVKKEKEKGTGSGSLLFI